MVAAVAKLMRVQDLILVAQKTRVVTRFRNTLGLRGRLSTRLQPNRPTDDATGIAASVLDGLLYGNGDAVIGINPASDRLAATTALLRMLDAVISGYQIPTQSCVLACAYHHHRSDRPWRAGGPGVSVDRRHRGGQCQLRHQPGLAAGRL